MSALTYNRALENRNKNRPGDDLAVVSPSKGKNAARLVTFCVVCFENLILRWICIFLPEPKMSTSKW